MIAQALGEERTSLHGCLNGMSNSPRPKIASEVKNKDKSMLMLAAPVPEIMSDFL
jgi:hypothetical protein